MRTIAAFIALTLAVDVLAAEDSPGLPDAAPPRIITAVALAQPGPVQLDLVIPVFVPENRVRVVERDGKKIEEEYAIMKAVYETRVVTADDGARVFDRTGKPVQTDALPALLKKKTAVLLSATSKLDPFYLPLLRDDVLIVVLSPEKK